jgi:hypothetical protein
LLIIGTAELSILSGKYGSLGLIPVVGPFISLFMENLNGSGEDLSQLNILIMIFISFISTLGLFKIGLDLYDGKKPQFTEIFGQYRSVFRYIVGTLIYLIIFVIGSIFLIIPGYYFAIKYMFYPLFIVEGKAGLESIKSSGRITKGHTRKLILPYFMSAFLYILSVFVFLLAVAYLNEGTELFDFIFGLGCLLLGLVLFPVPTLYMIYIYRLCNYSAYHSQHL